MNTMKEHKYKVEVFIIPEINKQLNTSTNEIDDLKVANITKLKKATECSENIMYDSEAKEKITFFETDCDFVNDQEIDENLQNKINSAHDENILCKLIQECVLKKTQMLQEKESPDVTRDEDESRPCNLFTKSANLEINTEGNELSNVGCDPVNPSIQKASTVCNTFLPRRTIRKFNSLISIDEQSEDSEENFSDFCRHGHKNGCTASVPAPEEVSDKIFQANWLEKLESLRQQEALLKQKELSLQERERSLFKREKDLRILERNVKEKMKMAELSLKRCKLWQDSIEAKKHEKVPASNLTTSNEFKESTNTDQKEQNLQSNRSTSPLDDNKEHMKLKDTIGIKQTNHKESLPNKRSHESHAGNDTKIKYHSSSRNSLNLHGNVRNHFGRHSTYSSLRIKPRPKISYDDLNSTLSADIGDASFVLTSKKLDPELIKRPIAFGRSTQECYEQKGSSLCSLPSKGAQHNLTSTEEKILKRISANILVSQDEETRFQNYGLIDQDVFNPNNGQHKAEKINSKEEDSVVKQKNRPTSWNGEAEEWLQKKRHAYNLTAKKVSTESFENKENVAQSTKPIKTDKNVKKKDGSKNKILSIFR